MERSSRNASSEWSLSDALRVSHGKAVTKSNCSGRVWILQPNVRGADPFDLGRCRDARGCGVRCPTSGFCHRPWAAVTNKVRRPRENTHNETSSASRK